LPEYSRCDIIAAETYSACGGLELPEAGERGSPTAGGNDRRFSLWKKTN